MQVEDRLKFYETGDLPKKNLEVMQEALEEVQKEASEFKTVEKKKKKKDKKVSNQIQSPRPLPLSAIFYGVNRNQH